MILTNDMISGVGMADLQVAAVNESTLKRGYDM